MGFFMCKNPSYVVRQSCGYCYRQVVPPDLRNLVGRTEIRYNLYTGSLRDAKSRARVISGQIQALFIKIKREKTSTRGGGFAIFMRIFGSISDIIINATI